MDELKPMLGLVCRQARLGYGGVLQLDLGDLVEYSHPRLKGKLHGVWRVRPHTGAWRIYDGGRLVAGHYDDEPVLEAAIGRFTDRRLLDIELAEASSDTRLRFSDSLSVDFLEASSIETNWEAYGPEIHISFGPGPHPAVSHLGETDSNLTSEERRLAAHTEECAHRWEAVVPPRAPDGRRCRECAYCMPLRGVWYFWDYGLCTHPASPFDGKVVNVETGCPEYSAELEYSNERT